MGLLDVEQIAADPAAQLRIGHVLQDELGLEDTQVVLLVKGLQKGLCSYLRANGSSQDGRGCPHGASSVDHDGWFFMTGPAFVSECVHCERWPPVTPHSSPSEQKILLADSSCILIKYSSI